MPRFTGRFPLQTEEDYHHLLAARERNEQRLREFMVSWVPAMKQQELEQLIKTVVSNHQQIAAWQATHDVPGREIVEY